MVDPRHATDRRAWIIVGAVLLLWLALTLILGASDSFARPQGALPLPILASLLTPILVFLIAFWTLRPFHDLVMTMDLQVMAGIQAWRFGGLGFLALYVYGILPGIFAWPAGLGDMAIGVTAPLVILALRRQPAFASSWLFRAWNLLGMLDLVVAVGLGAASAVLGLGITAEITSFPMGRMPLAIVPAFLVPIFLMLHLASLLQARHMGASEEVCRWTEPTLRCDTAEAMNRA